MMKPLVADKMMKGCSSELKILFISTCKEKLSELEYLNPIVELVKEGLKDNKTKIEIINYKDLEKYDKSYLNLFDLIVITGTALKDFDYFNYIKEFNKIKDVKAKKIGICAGAQILSLIYGIELKKLDKPLIEVVYSNEKKYYFLTNYLIDSNITKNKEVEFEEIEINSKKYVAYLNNEDLILYTYHPEVLNRKEFIEKLKEVMDLR